MTTPSNDRAKSRGPRIGATFIGAFVVAALVVGARLAGVGAGAGTGPSVAPDYGLAADWICRPGAEETCTTGLDALAVDASGKTTPLPFAPAANPPIDCFYVYPTVSKETTPYADLQPSPEILSAANVQVGRLSSRCRVFAPIYRQETIYGLQLRLNGRPTDGPDVAFADVAAAWAYYLAHDNNGRGVVLVGHSQGTILLQRLIKSAIDGRPEQKLLVSAFLAGDPSLEVPPGKTVGGTFAHVPVCSSRAETGCAYVWGSYLDADASRYHVFGEPLTNGMTSACVSPASPSGGVGKLEYFHRKASDAPSDAPPWVESLDQVTGTCQANTAGNSLIVSVLPGTNAAALTALLTGAQIAPGWGLHIVDVGLVQGNMLDVLDAEIATWTSSRR